MSDAQSSVDPNKIMGGDPLCRGGGHAVHPCDRQRAGAAAPAIEAPTRLCVRRTGSRGAPHPRPLPPWPLRKRRKSRARPRRPEPERGARDRQSRWPGRDRGFEARRCSNHLIELRQRLIYACIGIGIGFVICFAFATDIYNLLVWPYQVARGEGQRSR